MDETYNKHQNIRCFFGVHRYQVHSTEDLKSIRGEVIAKVLINRCVNCGKIRKVIIPVSTDYNGRV